jgi:hypothetical protein
MYCDDMLCNNITLKILLSLEFLKKGIFAGVKQQNGGSAKYNM